MVMTSVVSGRHAVPVSEPVEPEVSERATRRVFSPQYKLRIVEEYERHDRNGRGAVLRRGGLYTSSISDWRRQRLGRERRVLRWVVLERPTIATTVRARLRRVHLESEYRSRGRSAWLNVLRYLASSTRNALWTRRQRACTPICWMKAAISAQCQRCIACFEPRTRSASVDAKPRTPRRSNPSWSRPDQTRSGVEISPSFLVPRSGRTSTCTWSLTFSAAT